jgi:hypothetical protein
LVDSRLPMPATVLPTISEFRDGLPKTCWCHPVEAQGPPSIGRFYELRVATFRTDEDLQAAVRPVRIGSCFNAMGAAAALSDGCYSACKIDPLSRGIGVQN